MTLPVSIIIPTLNAASTLSSCIDAISEAKTDRIVIVDGGSTDETMELTASLKAQFLTSEPGRGRQLAVGANAVESDWLLFLHADTVLETGWSDSVRDYITQPENTQSAAYFQFALDNDCSSAQRLEKVVSWRCRNLAMPYGDQGLLIHKNLYNDIGGFHHLPLMEDVDLIRRLKRKTGPRGLKALPVKATTASDRYRRDGYLLRSTRNLLCLTAYWLGVPPHFIVRLYG